MAGVCVYVAFARALRGGWGLSDANVRFVLINGIVAGVGVALGLAFLHRFFHFGKRKLLACAIFACALLFMATYVGTAVIAAV